MPRGKAIMVQGTGSHVGKSVLATALCRIFRQDGYRVAPFKSRNMANNAAVCVGGGEIGRAQAEQAAACGLDPVAAMNPVLLKPCSDVGSQVVVMGRPVATMTAREYQGYKLSLLPVVQAALDEMLGGYDIVVIEGAGSPAEINLKAHDIVNMRTAAMADAPVILVADIDKGGVFAQLLGTFELLEPDERARVCGLLINKFRGDHEILAPGLTFIAERLQRPVLGVIPFMHDLLIAEEDTPREAPASRRTGHARQVRIDVIRHSRMANFTDFDALGDRVRYISEPPADMPDAVILPGTKSTAADLQLLRERGFDRWLGRARQAGVEIVGVCGGFQMLGRAVLDPDQVESSQAHVPGLGLLDCSTVFNRDKETARVAGVHLDSGTAVQGYEIHMGCTQGADDARPLFRIDERHGMRAEGYDGLASPDGRVWGTYLHGLFDNEAFRHWWLARLRPEAAAADLAWNSAHENRFDTLAAAVRNSIDVAQLYRVMGL
ncbi:MAG TPA: cobyric acid synthase [Pirellulales bacterium]|nr:cobyric acid synthase [Pirellulales bacterium]